MGESPIKHVVVLMMENHSFDEVLGCMKQINPTIDGVDIANLQSNKNYPATTAPVGQNPNRARSISHDPKHEHVDVLEQIADKCSGFVANFARTYSQSSTAERQQIMGYYPLGSLPVIHALAQNFTICDRWFSSLPGPTWPNRFFVHSGTCKGHVKMPSGTYIQNEHCYDQNTIYDELEKHNITWGIYHHGMCHTLILEHLWDKLDHFHRIDNFFRDADGDEGQFPQYVFIEPSYGGEDENDQHPPTDIRKGEYLIAQIYNAIRGNDALWKSTLLVLLYDEHGGFYDHVEPPPAIPPDRFTSEYSFNQYGVRVPAVLISPYVGQGGLFSSTLDHTSLLKFLCDKWNLDPATMGDRVPAAATFAPVLQTVFRAEALGAFDLSKLPLPPTLVPTTTNEHQNALVSFGHFLEQKMAAVEELAAAGYRSLKSLDGPLAQLSVAKDRFLLFLHHGQNGRLDT